MGKKSCTSEIFEYINLEFPKKDRRMKKLILAALFAQSLFAFPFFGSSIYKKSELTENYLKSKKALDEDQFANSLRRRNYLKDRFVFQFGWGSKAGAFGSEKKELAQGALGFTAEYIFSWGVFGSFSTWGSLASVAQTKDISFPDNEPELGGGNVWKLGLTHYFFSKYVLHPSISVSYGTVYFGNQRLLYGLESEATPKTVRESFTGDNVGVLDLVTQEGFQIDLGITYLDYQWYYLTFNIGYAFVTNDNSVVTVVRADDRFNPTSEAERTSTHYIAAKDNSLGTEHFVVGFGVGFALPDMFPDVTELRRREREDARGNISWYR